MIVTGKLSTYLAGFIATALIIGSIDWYAGWSVSVANCPVPGDGQFLAVCNNDHFGDYEHGAYLYGFEQEAIASLTRAEVVVAGDSRTQFGFSTAAVRDYFANHKVPYHLLALGYSSRSPMALAILSRHHVHPKVLIINAQPFFSDVGAPLDVELLDGGFPEWLGYARKSWFQSTHAWFCRWLPSTCRPPVGGVFRSEATGEWIWQRVLMAPETAVAFGNYSLTEEAIPDMTRLAAEFVSRLQIDPYCVILTAVPANAADAERVEGEVAHSIGATAIIPDVAGLMSLDGWHLNAESAERWSSAFVRMADDRITECLAR